MRILGYLDTKGYNTTVFKHETKFLIKFETELLEQTYKFRESEELQTLEDIKQMVDVDFLVEVENRFGYMYKDSNQMLGRFFESQDENWEGII